MPELASILTAKVKAFIADHATARPDEIALQAKKYPELPISFVAQQIKGRQRSIRKLPTWHDNLDTAFPSSVSMEQCSSERAAEYKANLIDGVSIADLTGGFGVDAASFAQRFERMYHIERNEDLSRIAEYNARVLGNGGQFFCGDGMKWLAEYEGMLDWVFIDPARRDERSLKVSAFQDCQPNILQHWDLIASKSRGVMIKASPGLDIEMGLSQLQNVREVHVVSIENECKELLFVCGKGGKGEPEITCVNLLGSEVERFQFHLSEEKGQTAEYGELGRYLYEPNASLMKGNPFNLLARKHGLSLIAPRTRFYTSSEVRPNFPGRVFEIQGSYALTAKSTKGVFPKGKANVIARNCGLSADELKKKLKLKDGGDCYAIGTMLASGERTLLKCVRLK